jgi:hypothetical protein
MSGVFRNIDSPTPSLPGECVPPAFGAGGGHTHWVERGWGVNTSEGARHCSVLYICNYFVLEPNGPALIKTGFANSHAAQSSTCKTMGQPK